MVAAVVWCGFAATYEFPRSVGFAVAPYPWDLAWTVVLRNAAMFVFAIAIPAGGFFLMRRQTRLTRKLTVAVASSVALIFQLYTWEPVARTVWGKPFGPTEAFDIAVFSVSALLALIGLLRYGRHGESPRWLSVAALVAVWAKDDMSFDRLVLAILVTLTAAGLALHLAGRSGSRSRLATAGRLQHDLG